MNNVDRLKDILSRSKAVMQQTEKDYGNTSDSSLTTNEYGEKEMPNLTENFIKENSNRVTQSVSPQQGKYRNIKTSKMPKEVLEAMINNPIEIPESPNHTFELSDVEDLVNESSQPTQFTPPNPTTVNSDSIRQIVREEIGGVVRKVVEEYLDKALITEDIQIKIGSTIFSGNLKPLPKKRKTKKRI